MLVRFLYQNTNEEGNCKIHRLFHHCTLHSINQNLESCTHSTGRRDHVISFFETLRWLPITLQIKSLLLIIITKPYFTWPCLSDFKQLSHFFPSLDFSLFFIELQKNLLVSEAFHTCCFLLGTPESRAFYAYFFHATFSERPFVTL